MASTESISLPRARSSPPVPSLPQAPPGLEPCAAACSHCGVAVSPERLDPASEAQFCCDGCRIVFGMLKQHGLDGYYAQGDAQKALATGRDYAEFDDPSFLALYARKHGDEQTLDLLLEGVHCAACVWLVEKLPELVPGVTACRLDYAQRLARVTFREPSSSAGSAPAGSAPGGSDPAGAAPTDAAPPGVAPAGAALAGAAPGAAPVKGLPSTIAQTLDRLGYPPHPHREGARALLQRREERDLLVRLGVAGASAGNSMLFALALYSGGFADMEAAHMQYFRVLSTIAALPALLWSAQVFYRGALGALRARRPHMDLPLSLGFVLGVAWGCVNLVRGAGEVYFDSLSTLVFVLLAARFLQVRQQARAERAAGSAQALTPRTARLLDGAGASRMVPAESVVRGARVEVLAGEVFPVDGRVESGRSKADTSWLTGESAPHDVSPGSAVFAGTINLMGRVQLFAEQSGAETRAARLWREMERASTRRAPIATLADRASAYFLVGILLLAAIGFIAWLPAGMGAAVQTAIAVLVVTCPCGLALATPLALSAALGQAARSGWLIKGSAALEALARPALIVFDKTGTLTRGELAVVRWFGDQSLAPAIKALEASSSHPIARAILRALEGVEPAAATDVVERLGQGVEGNVGGRRVSVGAVPFAARSARPASPGPGPACAGPGPAGSGPAGPVPAGPGAAAAHSAEQPLPPWAAAALEELGACGLSPVLVRVDGAIQSVLGLGDPLRPDAARALRELRRRGHRLALLSGDHPVVVDHVARQLAAEGGGGELFEVARGGVSPEGKLAFVEAARARGDVFMVGDGVNDAAALAAASVGIAVHGGAEASLAAAHVFATRPGVERLLELTLGARRTLRVIQTNLAFSLVYNVVAASLCLAGAVTPLWAAIIMPLSSLTVVAHSYRRRMFGGLS